jgi:hypothetical protein
MEYAPFKLEKHRIVQHYISMLARWQMIVLRYQVELKLRVVPQGFAVHDKRTQWKEMILKYSSPKPKVRNKDGFSNSLLGGFCVVKLSCQEVHVTQITSSGLTWNIGCDW